MTSLVSDSFSERLAVMLTSTPRAPDRSTPSSSGLATACSAARRARSTPDTVAVPIMALPCSPITVFTSSKSTFTRPSTLMISAMPATALCSTSSAHWKHLSISASSPITSNSFSLSTTISESTDDSSSPEPCSATLARRAPSKSNGLLTTPTVRMPISLATCATIGAAPVPVPPPMPAVMKTMCAPRRESAICSRACSAQLRPTSGLAPAPRPVLPSCSTRDAVERLSAWASVFMQMNSTPCTPRLIMCCTALPPAPPTPTTLMMVPSCISDSIMSKSITASVKNQSPNAAASPPQPLVPEQETKIEEETCSTCHRAIR
ncbi:hypothetical protein D3C87_1330430 [compost metagenome]